MIIETGTGGAEIRDTFSIEQTSEDMLHVEISREGSMGGTMGVPVMLENFKGLIRAFQLDK